MNKKLNININLGASRIRRLLFYCFEQQRWNKKIYYMCNILLAKVLTNLRKRPVGRVWLIGNGEDAFGNNAKYMYNYLKSNNNNIQLYWICDKKSMSVLRQNGVMNLVKRGSLKNYCLAQIAEVGIYTHSDSDIAPKWYRWFPRKTILVDLTHGNTGNKRLAPYYISEFALDIWCCCSKFERELIIGAGCAPEKAIITGMARYDGIPVASESMIFKPSKKILLFPTWREWYLNGDKDFKKTELFERYNKLIFYLKELDYNITFILHENFTRYYKDSVKSIWEDIKIVESSSQIQRELLDNDILITDYSSVLWEFVYQRKPLILYWYDDKQYSELSGKRIHSGGTYPEFQKIMEPYICRTMVDMEVKLKNYMQNKEVSLPPRDVFFEFSDQKNCERIYLAILAAIQNAQNEK